MRVIVGADPEVIPGLESLVFAKADPRLVVRWVREGIPSSVAEFCSYWPGNGRRASIEPLPGAVVVLRVGGMAPKRTLEELEECARLGLGFNLDLQPGFDLAILAKVFSTAPHLAIRGQQLAGWETLRQATALRSCNIAAAPSMRLQLDDLEHLEIGLTNGGNGLWIATNPHLRELVATTKSWPKGLTIGCSLRSLQLWEAARVHELPPMADKSSLEVLDIRYTKQFDMSSLLGATRLRKILLSQCSRVSNIEALAELPSLSSLQIGGVLEMPGWQELARLTLTELHLPNQRVMSAEDVRRLQAETTGYPSDRQLEVPDCHERSDW